MSTITTDIDIEIDYDGTNFTYGTNNYTSGPITIINSGSNQIVVSLNFSGNISNTNHYFTIGSNNITFDGQNIPITVDIGSYEGLIQNNLDTYYNIIIQNIVINSTNSGSIGNNCGWICSYFTINSLSNIACTVINCTSSGEIITGCGGIIGRSVNCEVYNSNSTGNILMFAGGIYGSGCVNCNAYNCYSTGNINTGAGGIFGSDTNFSASLNTISKASNCFSTGSINNSIGIGSGGIFGTACNVFASSSDTRCIASNCYSLGNIGGVNSYGNGGIFGSNCNINSSNAICTADCCSSYGNIYGDIINGSNGGIYGSSASNYCNALNCFSIGNIGYGSGGIFLSGDTITASSCYTIGNIKDNAGGIFGQFITNGTANNCYTIGDIGNSSGGIFGQSVSNCTANNCYSLGYLGNNAGGIFGDNSSSITTNNCYITNNLFTGPNVTSSTIINSIAENNNWNDINANATIGFGMNPWFSYTSNTPFLLGSFNTSSQYFNYIACPTGYKYSYLIPNITTITENQSISLQVLVGYYIGPQNDPTILSPDIYGYVFNLIDNGNLDINVQNGSGGNSEADFTIILFDEIKKPEL